MERRERLERAFLRDPLYALPPECRAPPDQVKAFNLGLPRSGTLPILCGSSAWTKYVLANAQNYSASKIRDLTELMHRNAISVSWAGVDRTIKKKH